MSYENSTPGDTALPLTRDDFIGAATPCPIIGGGAAPRLYLDTAATALMLRPAQAAGKRLLEHYASTHSDGHASAAVAAEALAWARREILALVDADPGAYLVFFGGSGSTASLNWLARSFRALRPERGTVVLSGLEHHSNDLPHRPGGRVRHLPLTLDGGPETGGSLASLRAALSDAGEDLNYLAVTGASNVTGLLTPLPGIVDAARAAGALVLVDGSQLVPHAPLSLTALARAGQPVDALVFSGHKTYAPGSPGVAVVRRELAEAMPAAELGGGMVGSVYPHEFSVHEDVQQRFEAGTPNIVGAFSLGVAARALRRCGLERIHAREMTLVRSLWTALGSIPGVRLYGPDPGQTPRTGCVSFNVEGVDHGLTARILSDYFAIQVRSGCFCAEPYVRALLRDEILALDVDPDAADAENRIARRLGLVRASFGIYNDDADVSRLVAAVTAIAKAPEDFTAQYREVGATGYAHCAGELPRPPIDALLED